MTNYPKIQVMLNGQLLQEYKLVKNLVLIGRANSNDLILTDPQVSREQAALSQVGGVWFLEPKSINNPTEINGRVVKGQASLKYGDKIKVGKLELIFLPELVEINKAQANSSVNPGRALELETSLTPTLTLEFMDNAGQQVRKEYKLKENEITVGRSSENMIVIPSILVSRSHAILRRTSSSYKIINTKFNLGNALIYNGLPIKELILKDGDIINIGSKESGFVTLTYHNPNLPGQPVLKAITIRNGNSKVTIGSAWNNEFILNNPHVSANHAVISKSGLRTVITDLNSLWGTFVEGKRIKPFEEVLIKPGNLIQIADITLTYEEDIRDEALTQAVPVETGKDVVLPEWEASPRLVRVSLSDKKVELTPGSETLVGLTVTNRSREVIAIEVEVVGLEADWYEFDQNKDEKLFRAALYPDEPNDEIETKLKIKVPASAPFNTFESKVVVRKAGTEELLYQASFSLTILRSASSGSVPSGQPSINLPGANLPGSNLPDAQGLRVSSDQPALALTPGERGFVTLTIENTSKKVESYRISVTGVNPQWWGFKERENLAGLFPGQKNHVTLYFQIPAEATSWAGIYEVKITVSSIFDNRKLDFLARNSLSFMGNFNHRVNSRAGSGFSTTINLKLRVRRWGNYKAELLTIKKGKRDNGQAGLGIENLCNYNITIKIVAIDVNKQLKFDYNPVIELGANQKTLVPVKVTSQRRNLIGNSQVYDYVIRLKVIAGTEKLVSLVNNVRTLHGRYIYRPPIPWWVIIAIGLLLALVTFYLLFIVRH